LYPFCSLCTPLLFGLTGHDCFPHSLLFLCTPVLSHLDQQVTNASHTPSYSRAHPLSLIWSTGDDCFSHSLLFLHAPPFSHLGQKAITASHTPAFLTHLVFLHLGRQTRNFLAHHLFFTFRTTTFSIMKIFCKHTISKTSTTLLYPHLHSRKVAFATSHLVFSLFAILKIWGLLFHSHT